MEHAVFRILAYKATGPHSFHVEFDTRQEIDLKDTLEGEIYGPLKNPLLFSSVELDPEAHTLVGPNGADFDPETLHDWPKYEKQIKDMARRWAANKARGSTRFAGSMLPKRFLGDHRPRRFL